MFGNGLDMYGHIDKIFKSDIAGGITLIRASDGDYSGAGGTWVEQGPSERIPLNNVNVQPASGKDMKLSVDKGGTADISDLRTVHINDGVYIYPDDEGRYADMLEFSDGVSVRQWRVIHCDNRPWRNFCRAIVERYRGKN